MSNNHSIKILRGTRANIAGATSANSANVLEPGQLLYNFTDNYLTVGGSVDGSSNSTVTKLPIIVREVKGYSADNSAIVTTTDENSSWHFGHDGTSAVEVSVKGFALNLKSTSNVNVTSGANVVIKGGNGDNGKITITKDGSIEVKRASNATTYTSIELGTTNITAKANNGSFTAYGGKSSLSIANSGNITANVNNTLIATIKTGGIDLDDATDSGRKFIGTSTASDYVWVKTSGGTTVKHSFEVTNALPSSPSSNTIYFIY